MFTREPERMPDMNDTWSKADLHAHTTHSDGHASVEEVLEYASLCTDLRVVAVTDHDTIDGALEARSLADEYGVEVVVGEEVSTADGELLALFIEERLPPGRPASETIAAVHEQGGLCVAAHPYARMVPSMGRYLPGRCLGPSPEWPLDAVETFNAGLWTRYANDRAARAADGLDLPPCGGSDSHHLATLGLGYTYFPGDSAADLRASIEDGRTRAAGRPWGVGRTAEAIALISRRELRKLMGRIRYDRERRRLSDGCAPHAESG